nr:Myb-like DNA-binding domain [uncultured organism]
MDDIAASQQLIEEGMRADVSNRDHASLTQLNGIDDKPLSKRKKRKRRSMHKSTDERPAPTAAPAATQDSPVQDADPESSPFPFPATQPDIQSTPRPNSPSPIKATPFLVLNDSASSPIVEVPDSQFAASTAPEPTSSPKLDFVVPSSAIKSKRTYKKRKQSMEERLLREAALEFGVNHDGDMATGAYETASASYTLSNRKRPRTENAEPGLPEVEGEETTPASKRHRITKSKHATTVQDLLQDSLEYNANGFDDDGQLHSAKKSKLKRVKKPRTPVAKVKNVYDIPDDEPQTPDGVGEAGGADEELQSNGDVDVDVTTTASSFIQPRVAEEVNVTENTSTRKPRIASKGVKNYDRPAPVRKPGQSSSEASGIGTDDEHTILREPDSSDDEIPHRRPDNYQPAAKKKKSAKKTKVHSSTGSSKEASIPSTTPQRRRSGKFDTTPAENALYTIRDLNQPSVLRDSGEFTEDEEELIRRAIVDYQQRKNLEIVDLVQIIQWNKHDPALYRADHSWRKSNWSAQDEEDARESAEFWAEIGNINMTRPLEKRKRHIRAVYHCYKTGAWSEAEDENLRKIYAAHPKQWKAISITMGTRSMQDCQNRWRDYVQYGENRKTSRWSLEEEELLIRAVNTIAQRDEDLRAETGKPPIDNYTSKDINWPQVSHEMGDIRSRIQASVKWNNMRKREDPPEIQVEYKPRKLQAQSIISATPKKRGRPRKSDIVNTMIENSDMGEQGVRGAEQSKPAAGYPAPKKPRKSRLSGNKSAQLEPEEPSNELPQKKRGRPRKSENLEVETPEKLRTSKTSQEDSRDAGQNEVLEPPQEDESFEDNQLEESPPENDREEDSAQEENRKEDTPPDESPAEESRQDASPEAESIQEENTPPQDEDEMVMEDQVDPVVAIEDRTTGETSEPKEITAPGVDQMLWGDKYDLISKLQERRDEDETEEDVDWQEVANGLNDVWTPQTLQTALRQLVELLRDRGKDVDEDDFPGTVDDIMDMICGEHGQELEDHFIPSQGDLSKESVQSLQLVE